jgi:hypothetical protein
MSKDIREMIDKVKNFKQFVNENINPNVWYRGYTTNTKDNEFSWITSNKEHAKQYAEINKYSYGGLPKVDEFIINESGFDLTDLYSYDMDDMISEDDCEDFLSNVNIEYEYENLFDIMEDEIPLSRLVNKILSQLTLNNDGFKIMENGIKTIYIKTELLK